MEENHLNTTDFQNNWQRRICKTIVNGPHRVCRFSLIKYTNKTMCYTVICLNLCFVLKMILFLLNISCLHIVGRWNNVMWCAYCHGTFKYLESLNQCSQASVSVFYIFYGACFESWWSGGLIWSTALGEQLLMLFCCGADLYLRL